MAESPIFLRSYEVRAILDNRKTMTRLVVKLPAGFTAESVRRVDFHSIWGPDTWVFNGTGTLNNETCKGFHRGIKFPFGQPGDVLWCKEAWAVPHKFDHLPPRMVPAGTRVYYPAQDGIGGLMSRQSTHMPRWAARIFLEVTGVRVERLQDISREDIRAEGLGLPPSPCFPHKENRSELHSAFAYLWDSLAKSRQRWENNPWTWVITFKRLEDYHG